MKVFGYHAYVGPASHQRNPLGDDADRDDTGAGRCPRLRMYFKCVTRQKFEAIIYILDIYSIYIVVPRGGHGGKVGRRRANPMWGVKKNGQRDAQPEGLCGWRHVQ